MRRQSFKLGLSRQNDLPVPVVVVGNISVGGVILRLAVNVTGVDPISRPSSKTFVPGGLEATVMLSEVPVKIVPQAVRESSNAAASVFFNI